MLARIPRDRIHHHRGSALDADLDRLLPLRREYLHGIFCFIERTHRLGCMLLEEEPFFGQTNIATLSCYERYP